MILDSPGNLNLPSLVAPRAAVVIGCYNNESFICEAINSIKTQSYISWMCLVIDNSSADRSRERVAEGVAGDSRFSVVVKENQGPSAWRNFAASLLPDSINYIHFLDGDDFLEPNFLAEAVNYLDSNPSVGLVNFQFNIIDECGSLLGPGHRSRFAPSRLGLPSCIPDEIYPTPFVSFFSATGQGPFCVFRKSVYDQTSGYELDFWSHEDSDICCQMAMLARCHQLPLRLYNKRTHSANLTHSPKADYSKFRAKWDFYRPANEERRIVLVQSLRYYYIWHMPFRDFKVALKALRQFVASGELRFLRWALFLLGHGISNLLFHFEYRRVMAERRCRPI
jgi:glycosyltransferase involved in cell wall biosynthesis